MSDIISDGKTKVTWVDSVNVAAPSAAVLNAGLHMEGWITPDGLGIDLGDDSVDTSKLNSTFSSAQAGRGTVSIEVTFADQGKTESPWIDMVGRPAGYLVVRRNVDSVSAYASGQFVEVYTVTCGDPKIIPPAENELSKFAVDMFSSKDPVLHAVCAA